MNRLTTIEMSHQYPNGAVAILDVERLGAWARFSAVIEERQASFFSRPVIVQLGVKNDEGEPVDVDKDEHARITGLFIEAYNRWRRQDARTR